MVEGLGFKERLDEFSIFLRKKKIMNVWKFIRCREIFGKILRLMSPKTNKISGFLKKKWKFTIMGQKTLISSVIFNRIIIYHYSWDSID